MLTKFQIRQATTPRNSPFTFKEDGFYRQLKHEVRDVLKTIPATAAVKSIVMTDTLLFAYVLTAILAAKIMNYYVGAASGLFLGLVTIAAHNFFHQKDSFRMFYFDLSTMSSRFVNKLLNKQTQLSIAMTRKHNFIFVQYLTDRYKVAVCYFKLTFMSVNQNLDQVNETIKKFTNP